jgi:hypothetical protein
MNQRPHFGVTRYANGQYLVQTVKFTRKTLEGFSSDSPVKPIGVFPSLQEANEAYERWIGSNRVNQG